ncbi:hypothetical protein IRW11_004816 [Salmonella enterica subsp. enterica serovar Derby]|nr:hypothetical protein [Salmonella enterica subsp. enterica serovar Derby]
MKEKIVKYINKYPPNRKNTFRKADMLEAMKVKNKKETTPNTILHILS